MACGPENQCCETCRSTPRRISSRQSFTASPSAVAKAGIELTKQIRALIDSVEAAVKASGECGAYGIVEDAFVDTFGTGKATDSSDECQAYLTGLANLRLWEGQLNDAIDRGDVDRAQTIAADIEDVAKNLADTASISSFHNAAIAWAAAVGKAAGEAASTAVDAAGSALANTARSIGLGRLLVVAAVVTLVFYPGLLRRVTS